MKKLTKPRTEEELERIGKFLDTITITKHPYIKERVFEKFKKGYRVIPNAHGNDYDDFFTMRGVYELHGTKPMGQYIQKENNVKELSIKFAEKNPLLFWELGPRESTDYYSLCSEPWKEKRKYPVGYPHLTLEFGLDQEGPFRTKKFVTDGHFLTSHTEDIGYFLRESICLEPLSPLPSRFFCNLVEPFFEKGCLSGIRLLSGVEGDLMITSTAINLAVKYLAEQTWK